MQVRPRGQHDELGPEGEIVPPLLAVLARMWRRHSFRHLLAGSAVASLVGFGLNAFLAVRDDAVLELRADGGARYEDFDKLLAIIKRSGIERLAFVGNERFEKAMDR